MIKMHAETPEPVVPFRHYVQGGNIRRVNPAFDGKCAADTNVQARRCRHADIATSSIETKCLADFSSGETQTLLQSSVALPKESSLTSHPTKPTPIQD